MRLRFWGERVRVLRNIFRRKLRAFLTIFGISIGVFALVVMGSIAEKLTLLVDGGVKYYQGKIIVMPSTTMTTGGGFLNISKQRDIERVYGVRAVEADVGARLTTETITVSFGTVPSVSGSDQKGNPYETFKITYTSGRALRPTENGKVVVGSDLVKKLDAKVGGLVKIRDKSYEVVGIMGKTLTAPDNAVTMTLHDAQEIAAEDLPDVFKATTNPATIVTSFAVYPDPGANVDVVARAIHVNSLRKDRPFVAVNCGALSETLLDSELFGHMRGAFTGADTNKKGLIEVAEKGTIFLDEIGEMSPLVQVKVLRVLQERKFRRLGGTEEVDADIRIIAATNKDLSKLVADGRFREDLFYRINVIPIRLPALRERKEDIPLLAEHFVAKYGAQMGKAMTGVSGAAMAALQNYAWPGNIRELENAMERAVALERTPSVLVDSLPEQVRGMVVAEAAAVPATAVPSDGGFPAAGFDLEQHVQDIEREYIAEALRRAGGVKVKAAELLGMSFRSFRYYMKKYNLK